jgi:hypothetical protein
MSGKIIPASCFAENLLESIVLTNSMTLHIGHPSDSESIAHFPWRMILPSRMAT